MDAVLRQAVATDAPAIMRVRYAVKENRLVSLKIADEEVVHAIEVTGRGWVVELEGEVVAFAIGNATDGNLWALFVDPAHERKGYGRRLHDTMLAWLWSTGLERLWLSTDPQTRARRFYDRAGWREVGPLPTGEVLLEKHARQYPLVRRARPEDAPAIAEVHVSSWRAAYGAFLSEARIGTHTIASRARMWEQVLGDAGSVVFVAQVCSRIVGFCSASASHDPDLQHADAAEITAIYVEEGGWRRGHGRALLEAVGEELQRRGFASASLWTFKRNAAACRFYDSLGFRPDGAAKEGSGPAEIEVRYAKRLGTR